jgi:hypothetical protein
MKVSDRSPVITPVKQPLNYISSWWSVHLQVEESVQGDVILKLETKIRCSKTVESWEMKDKNCQNVRFNKDKFVNILLTEIGRGMLKFIVFCQ